MINSIEASDMKPEKLHEKSIIINNRQGVNLFSSPVLLVLKCRFAKIKETETLMRMRSTIQTHCWTYNSRPQMQRLFW